MWYEPSETITKADINGDGLLYDRNEGDAGGYDAGTENGGDMNEQKHEIQCCMER